MQAARNIAEAIHLLDPDRPLQVINILDYTDPVTRFVFESGWQFASTKFRRLYGLFHRLSVKNDFNSRIIQYLMKRAINRFLSINASPSIFIATHPLASVAGAQMKQRTSCLLCVVATDFMLHASQISALVNRYFVPPWCETSSKAEKVAAMRGHISVTGIPISPAFSATSNREQARMQMGLSRKGIVVLLSFGGSGLCAERHLNLCADLIESGLPLQFLVLLGTNRFALSKMKSRYPRAQYGNTVQCFGFVDDMPTFYAAADIFIGKSGGLSVSEAAATKLPMIIIDELPGQEEVNATVISKLGLGRRTHTSEETIDEIRRIIKTAGPTAGHLTSLGAAQRIAEESLMLLAEENSQGQWPTPSYAVA